MTSAIDTNVLVALWDRSESVSARALRELDTAQSRGPLVVCGPVYAELLAAPGRDEKFVDAFLRDVGIVVDWEMGEAIWREAGRAYRLYAQRRRRGRGAGSRRILADFLIGSHALRNGYCLLTSDQKSYRAAFPNLKIVSV